MPPAYKRVKGEFRFKGVNLNCAVDSIPADQLGIATNVRPTQQGTLGLRPALASYLNPGSGAPIHSLKRFTANNLSRLYSGAGASLYGDGSPYLLDSGYSGNPLSFAAYQPLQAVEPFLYVADSARYSKVRNTDGKRFNVGIAPPSGPPDAELIQPLYSPISDFAAVWTSGGTAGPASVIPRFVATVNVGEILYDSGNTGWACVSFDQSGGSLDTAWQTKGARLQVDSELSVISEMVQAASQSTYIDTSIAAIQYDIGSTGACVVVLASNTTNIQRNSLVGLNVELVRVLSVAIGEDNSVSFRCVTVSTHAAGEPVLFFNSARMYFTQNHTAGAPVTCNSEASAIATGVGTISYTPSAPLDVSQINGRPLAPQDWMHISLKIDNLASIVLVRVLLDVDSYQNDFLHNYYYADITASVLQSAASGSASNVATGLAAVQASTTLAQIQALEAEIAALGAAGDVAAANALQGSLTQLSAQAFSQQQLVTGQSQWSEIFVPLSSLTRVGGDQTVGLGSVVAIRIEITCSAPINIQASSWWAGGTYGPNAPELINPENPIKYCFRYRSTITGAQSTWSPLTRGGLFPERQGIIASAAYSTDPQVDTLDFARVGASVDGTPQILSTIPNVTSGGIGTFDDNFADAQLGDQIAPGDNQPWPIQQSPIVGTCNVVGTTVFGTTVTIPTKLCEGTIVLINGVATVIRGLPSATSFQIEDNIATATGATLQINSPTTFGNPLPYMAGPFDECFFAMGDPLNPTRIYFSNRGNPETAATSNFVDLPTNNPGLGVCIWNGYVVAMTGDEFIVGTNSSGGTSPYLFTTTSVGCGLLAPWAFTTGPAIFFWTKNGIAATDLGPAKSLTQADLYPYFPHEGVPGVATNGYSPPATGVMPRLGYCKNGWLYVDFQTAAGPYQTLALDTNKPGWWFDTYLPQVLLHYDDEIESVPNRILCGCADGTIDQLSSNASDVGGAINCQARLGSNNFGDMRSMKQAIDLAIETNGTVTVKVLAASWVVQIISQAVTGASGAINIIPIADAYDPTKLYLDLAIDLTWTGNQGAIEYDLGYLQNPMLAADFVSNPIAFGFEGYGHVREVILNSITTAALTANLVIQCEFPGTITIPLTIPPGAKRQYIPLPPNKGMLYEWSIQGSGPDFGLFACDAHVKGWTEETYRNINPFVE